MNDLTPKATGAISWMCITEHEGEKWWARPLPADNPNVIELRIGHGRQEESRFHWNAQTKNMFGVCYKTLEGEYQWRVPRPVVMALEPMIQEALEKAKQDQP